VFANEEILARRWPAYHDLLVTHTRLRSVLALSLHGRLQAVGGMDLYFADPDGVTAVDVYEARCVAELVSDHLDVAADWSVWTSTELPAWSDTLDARRRGRLWMAVGMLMLALEAPAPDALAVRRATPTRPVGRPTTSPATWSSGACNPSSCVRTRAATADRPNGQRSPRARLAGRRCRPRQRWPRAEGGDAPPAGPRVRQRATSHLLGRSLSSRSRRSCRLVTRSPRF
jgi:hypothetical protein